MSAVDFVFTEWRSKSTAEVEAEAAAEAERRRHQVIPGTLRRTNSDPNLGSPSMRKLQVGD